MVGGAIVVCVAGPHAVVGALAEKPGGGKEREYRNANEPSFHFVAFFWIQKWKRVPSFPSTFIWVNIAELFDQNYLKY